MRIGFVLAICFTAAVVITGQQMVASKAEAALHSPEYGKDGRLNYPGDYREWVYLSTGLDMSYTAPSSNVAGHSTFDNVFVTRQAYRSFVDRGTWPDGTMFALEVRKAESNASINKAGHFQGEQRVALEVHVKDASHGGWAFYGFTGSGPGKMLAKDADCYSCHRDHGAVDTTFVQFYPTLMPVARLKKTLSAGYLNQ